MKTRVRPRSRKGHPRGSLVVVFEERRIGIDLRMVALAQDQLGMGDIKRAVKVGSACALDAVIRPKDLRPIGSLYCLEGAAAFMRGCE